MGFINYKSHLSVALDHTEPQQNRMWALRSCCVGVCSLVEVIEVDELTHTIAVILGAEWEDRSGRILLTSHFNEAAHLLTEFRMGMIEQKHRYDAMRRAKKRCNRRFPVQRPFERTAVLEALDAPRGKRRA